MWKEALVGNSKAISQHIYIIRGICVAANKTKADIYVLTICLITHTTTCFKHTIIVTWLHKCTTVVTELF
jgi:hypothetical protein